MCSGLVSFIVIHLLVVGSPKSYRIRRLGIMSVQNSAPIHRADVEIFHRGNVWPAGGARRKVRWSPNSAGFILRGPWVSRFHGYPSNEVVGRCEINRLRLLLSSVLFLCLSLPISETAGCMNEALTKSMSVTHFSLFSPLLRPSLPLLPLLSSPPLSVCAKDLSGFHLFVGTLLLSPLVIFSYWESSSAANTLVRRSTSHVWPCSTNPRSLHITPGLTTDAAPNPPPLSYILFCFCLHSTTLLLIKSHNKFTCLRDSKCLSLRFARILPLPSPLSIKFLDLALDLFGISRAKTQKKENIFGAYNTSSHIDVERSSVMSREKWRSFEFCLSSLSSRIACSVPANNLYWTIFQREDSLSLDMKPEVLQGNCCPSSLSLLLFLPLFSIGVFLFLHLSALPI